MLWISDLSTSFSRYCLLHSFWIHCLIDFQPNSGSGFVPLAMLLSDPGHFPGNPLIFWLTDQLSAQQHSRTRLLAILLDSVIKIMPAVYPHGSSLDLLTGLSSLRACRYVPDRVDPERFALYDASLGRWVPPELTDVSRQWTSQRLLAETWVSPGAMRAQNMILICKNHTWGLRFWQSSRSID